MNTRSLLILTGATVVVAGVAALTLHHRENAVRASAENRTLFPELARSINDVATITIQRKDGEYTLQRNGDAWGMADKKGYPVDITGVRKLVNGVSDLTTVEAKTADPARYAVLGVQEPEAEGSTSSKVTLKDAGGQVLASVIVGKPREGKGGPGGQVFVRKAGDAQSWLANGTFDLHEHAAEWLSKEVLKVEKDRVRSVEVKHPDGEVVLVDREKAGDATFALHDIPDGKELSYPTVAGSLASALEWVNLDDVVPATDVDMKEGVTSTAKFTCFDGLVVTVTTKDVGDKTYARFEAAFEAPPAAPPAVEPPTPAEPEKKPEAEKKPKTPEEVQKEVADVNAKTASWTYVIPSYNKASFAKRKSEMLKDKAPPAALTPTEPMPGGEMPTPPPPTPPPTEPPH